MAWHSPTYLEEETGFHICAAGKGGIHFFRRPKMWNPLFGAAQNVESTFSPAKMWNPLFRKCGHHVRECRRIHAKKWIPHFRLENVDVVALSARKCGLRWLVRVKMWTSGCATGLLVASAVLAKKAPELTVSGKSRFATRACHLLVSRAVAIRRQRLTSISFDRTPRRGICLKVSLHLIWRCK